MRMKRPTVTVTTPRRRPGARPISTSLDPSADVHVTLDPDDYDRVFAIAVRERISVPEVLRRALKMWPSFIAEPGRSTAEPEDG